MLLSVTRMCQANDLEGQSISPLSQHTLHQDLLHDFTELLHDGLGQIMALFGFLEPLVETSSGPQLGRARLGHTGTGGHGGWRRC